MSFHDATWKFILILDHLSAVLSSALPAQDLISVVFCPKNINFRYLPIIVNKVGSLLCLFYPLPSLDLIHCLALPCIVLLFNTAIFGASWDFFPTRGCGRVWPKTNLFSGKKYWYSPNCFLEAKMQNKQTFFFFYLVLGGLTFQKWEWGALSYPRLPSLCTTPKYPQHSMLQSDFPHMFIIERTYMYI